ncbi:glycosyltransferase [Candidatus Sumerlaeota bacterium]|nr:glycosyltransferase [Candidatus Sumerlaeota bacterium]
MIHVVIPTLNEEARIGELLDAIARALVDESWRVIHVDDGSSDRTVEIAALRCAEGLPIETVRHPENRGIRQTFHDGFTAALAGTDDDDVVVLMEGDMTSDPALLPVLIGAVRAGHDVAIASRYRRGSGQPGFPFKRKLMSWVLNRLLLRLWVGLPGVRDYSIFYRAYRAGTLRRGFETHGDSLMTCSGFGANAQLLCRLGRLGARCTEIPFVYNYALCEGHSSIPIGRTIREYFQLLCSLRRR